MLSSVTADAFRQQYASVFEGAERWQSLPVPTGDRFDWEDASTYIRRPPFLENLTLTPAPRADLAGARALAVLGDSITTDHISPAGNIKADSPAGRYLVAHGVAPKEFNSYGARRGNHEVMMRGTFANVRIKNQMVPGVEGGVTVYLPGDEVMPIYDAAMKYQEAGVPLIILAGKEYGSGSSRDWAAKGTMLLGVKAVVAESFERIHRSNLVNMGVLPLQFVNGETVATHGLSGRELFAIEGAGADLKPRSTVTVRATGDDGSVKTFRAAVRIDTPEELTAYSHGGILPYVLRQLVKKN
jgi:aconitate hydratase